MMNILTLRGKEAEILSWAIKTIIKILVLEILMSKGEIVSNFSKMTLMEILVMVTSISKDQMLRNLRRRQMDILVR
jgi:hypothetical protein